MSDVAVVAFPRYDVYLAVVIETLMFCLPVLSCIVGMDAF